METKQLGNLEVRIFSDLKELSLHAAQIFVKEVESSQKETFTVSLSGGTTPKPLFELLGNEFKDRINWKKVHVFWGDERDLKESPESSFQLAFNSWLNKIPEFENNIHRIKMELGIEEGAKDYEKEINKLASEGFDLAINGAGSDGHRNGIMPENQNVDWKNNIWDISNDIKVWGYSLPSEINPYTERITVTPWFLNKSKTNLLLLSGKDKASLLRKITVDKDKFSERELPAVNFNKAKTIVLADKEAASEI